MAEALTACDNTRLATNLFGFTQYDGQCEFFGEGAPLPVRALYQCFLHRLHPGLALFEKQPSMLRSESFPTSTRYRRYCRASLC